jgi:8-oxo-dGTP diphosphatase
MKGAGIIFLNSNNEVLLLLRDDNSEILYPNMWDIPGGNVENDENPEETVKREMIEEMGLSNLGEISLFKIFTSENLTDYIFWKRLDINPAEIDLKEGQKIEYFNIDRIRKTKLAFNYNKVLEEFFREIVNNV